MNGDHPPAGLPFQDKVEWYKAKKERQNIAFDQRLAAGELRFDHSLGKIVENTPARPSVEPTPAGAVGTAKPTTSQAPARMTTATPEPSCPEVPVPNMVSRSKLPNRDASGISTRIQDPSKATGKPQTNDASPASSEAMEMPAEIESSPEIPLASLSRSRQSSAYSSYPPQATSQAISRETSSSVEPTRPANTASRKLVSSESESKSDNKSDASIITEKKRPSITQPDTGKLPKIPRMALNESASSTTPGGFTKPQAQPRVPKSIQSGTFGNAPVPAAAIQTPAQIFSEHVDSKGMEWNRPLSSKERSMIKDRNTAVALKNIKEDIRTAEQNKNDRKAHEKTLDSIRERLHKFEHLSGIDELIMRDSRLLTEESGLPRLFLSRQDGFSFPSDIRLDSKALFRKWRRQDFDPNIMRGIVTHRRRNDSGKMTTSSSISKDYSHRAQSGYYGAGDLVSGQWWPTMLAALRDGAHGETQGGISGMKDRGATSVVVSGSHYEDKDEGDLVYYCGTEPKLDEVKMTADTKLLYDNVRTKEPVRLLRSSKLNNAYSPTLGFRYDGVYDVIKGEPIPGKAHCHRFELRRQGDQDPIRYEGLGKRPTPDDIAAYQTHRDLNPFATA